MDVDGYIFAFPFAEQALCLAKRGETENNVIELLISKTLALMDSL